MDNGTALPSISPELKFSWYDYTLFSLMLLMSALIGVYFGFIKKQTTAKDYLLGGKEMSVFPISMSLLASSISGVTILTVPADVYSYGITYWLSLPMMVVVSFMAYYVFLPVFFELQITSTYEYLEGRFNNKHIRTFTSFLFALCMFSYLPIVIYVPALALSQGTGINIHLITPIVCGICIFYTTVGGLKAVVWTDALQFVIMIGAIVAVFFLGISNIGGIDVVWNRSMDMGRLTFDYDLDFTKRDTFWTGTIGMGFIWMNYIGTSQGFVQKCIALPNYKDVRNALIIFQIGMITLISMIVFTGLIMFATYHKCDPVTTHQVAKPDQILPFYIMDVAKSIPGLPGVFMAGIFSAALSTLSAIMNCLAATIYEDFLSPFISKDVSDVKVSNYLKWLAVTIGVICTSLVYVVQHLGNMLPLAFSIGGVTGGPMLGIFIVGMLFPKVHSKGVLWGGAISLVTMTWLISVSQWYQINKIIKYPTLPVSTEECTFALNRTSVNSTLTVGNDEEPFYLYRLSFYYYVFLGLLIVIIVGSVVSYLTKSEDGPLKKAYLSPVVRRLAPEEAYPPEYYKLEYAAKIVTHSVDNKT